MRDYLDALRTSLQQEGCYASCCWMKTATCTTTADDQSNFGFMYEMQSAGAQHGHRLRLYPGHRPVNKGKRLLYIGYDSAAASSSYKNVYDRSADYILSSTAPVQNLIFMVCYDEQSIYANDLHYSYFYHLVRSWKTQLPVWGIVFLLYLVLLFL